MRDLRIKTLHQWVRKCWVFYASRNRAVAICGKHDTRPPIFQVMHLISQTKYIPFEHKKIMQFFSGRNPKILSLCNIISLPVWKFLLSAVWKIRENTACSSTSNKRQDPDLLISSFDPAFVWGYLIGVWHLIEKIQYIFMQI